MGQEKIFWDKRLLRALTIWRRKEMEREENPKENPIFLVSGLVDGECDLDL